VSYGAMVTFDIKGGDLEKMEQRNIAKFFLLMFVWFSLGVLGSRRSNLGFLGGLLGMNAHAFKDLQLSL